MNVAHAGAAPGEVVERYLSRIEAHLARLGQGHDPMGHPFAIERLARAARAEWWDAQPRVDRERADRGR
jgi:hypothetical protein